MLCEESSSGSRFSGEGGDGACGSGSELLLGGLAELSEGRAGEVCAC